MNIKSYYTNTNVFKMNVYLDFMKIPIRFMCVFGNTNTLLFHLKGQLLNISDLSLTLITIITRYITVIHVIRKY